MINTVFRLSAPRRFEIAFEDIEIFGKNAVVRPTHLSICNADMRYYLGTRDARVLAEKLPMALIHEGAGEVVFDPSGRFKAGARVVMIPNKPVEADEFIAENYLRSSKFCGSTMDGFLQEYVEIEPKRLVELPENINILKRNFKSSGSRKAKNRVNHLPRPPTKISQPSYHKDMLFLY